MVLDLSPAPGAATSWSAFLAQTGLELKLVLRNGEQALLTLIIPLVLLGGLGSTSIVQMGTTSRIATALAGVLAVAVLSSAFTGPAIAVGFDRRSGSLRLLGTTPLRRSILIAAKATSILIVEGVQVVLLGLMAGILGWKPTQSTLQLLPTAFALILLATLAFSALAVALAGWLRAEATLAVANALFVLLLLGGGTALPPEKLPHQLATLTSYLPSGALGDGLRACLSAGTASVGHCAVILGIWALLGVGVAARTFKWD
ncbi:MAG: ABC transporter permease [Actinomycetes bacterium]